MTEKNAHSARIAELRRQAEEKLAHESLNSSNLSPEDAAHMVHELRTHQIELEMQNAELREAQLKLQDANSRYVDLYDFAPVGYLTLGENSIIIEANLTACSLLHVERELLVGKPFQEFISDVDQDVYYKQSRLHAESDVLPIYELRMKRPEADDVWVRVRSRIGPSGRSNAENVRIVLSDITDQKKAEAEAEGLRENLVRAERMASLSVLAGGVAHDLNNMLGPLVVLPDMVLEKLQSLSLAHGVLSQDLIDSLEIMKTSAKRSAEVVKDLSHLGRSASSKLVPLDLNSLSCLRKCTCTIDLKASYPNITFTSTIADAPLAFVGCESHLQRACCNLIYNAAESISGEGIVSLKTFQEELSEALDGYETIPPGRYAVLTVGDSGKGIRPENLSHIFEPYFTRKKKSERSGSGLGLSVVHGVTRDFGGFIDVTSEEGKGTVFKLYFPLLDA